MSRAIKQVGFAAIFWAVALPVYAAPAPKVDVCHREGNGGSHIINVSGNAVSAHLGHGDRLVGPETCDGIDNDCDGVVDDGIAPVAITCGLGECTASGLRSCVNGRLVDACTPGAPQSETCDLRDNDCNGVVDNIPAMTITCGTGACSSTGEVSCRDGMIVNSCTPGQPGSEVCGNDVDEDCDGDAPACPPTSSCRTVSFGGHDYQICQGARTRSEARAYCQGVGGGWDLASIGSSAENTFVVDSALALFSPYVDFTRSSYWISATDEGQEGTWQSADGSTFTSFASGEPNGGAGENCVHILRYPDQPYGWNDAGCEVWRWGWVCESSVGTSCNGHRWYSDGTTGRSWSEARALCQGLGGDLASIHSAADQACAEATLTAANAPSNGGWIGFFEQGTNNNFQWSDGTPVDFTRWLAGEPNNDSGGPFDCGHLWRAQSYQWNDIACARNGAGDVTFLCKF